MLATRYHSHLQIHPWHITEVLSASWRTAWFPPEGRCRQERSEKRIWHLDMNRKFQRRSIDGLTAFVLDFSAYDCRIKGRAHHMRLAAQPHVHWIHTSAVQGVPARNRYTWRSNIHVILHIRAAAMMAAKWQDVKALFIREHAQPQMGVVWQEREI